MASGKDLETMESAQPLGESKMAVDAVLLSCSGQDGSYLVAAIARRQLKMNNTIFTIRVPDVGVLVHPKHPDTTMFTGKKSYRILRCIESKLFSLGYYSVTLI